MPAKKKKKVATKLHHKLKFLNRGSVKGVAKKAHPYSGYKKNAKFMKVVQSLKGAKAIQTSRRMVRALGPDKTRNFALAKNLYGYVRERPMVDYAVKEEIDKLPNPTGKAWILNQIYGDATTPYT